MLVVRKKEKVLRNVTLGFGNKLADGLNNYFDGFYII